MRIATTQAQAQLVQAMLDKQSQLARTQQQLATGQRLLTPADDPTAAVRTLALNRALDRLATFGRNGDLAESRLQAEEGALAALGDILLRARELALEANTAAQDGLSRGAIAAELRSLNDQLLQVANQRDANGEYLFGGDQSRQIPFVRDAGGAVRFTGDAGQRLVSIGEHRLMAVSDSGERVLLTARDGNGLFRTDAATGNTGTGRIDAGSVTDRSAWVADTYTLNMLSADQYEIRDSGGGLVTSGVYVPDSAISFNGVQITLSGAPAAGDRFEVRPSGRQDMFQTLAQVTQAVADLDADPATAARGIGALGRGIEEIDQALGHLQTIRTEVGSRLNALDGQRESHADEVLNLQSLRSQLQDLDYTEAIGRLNLQTVALQAAQQSYLKLQGLSLFDLLR
ncbi:MAG: flagellar hook-associated protein FlgL [Pseudomonadota bacterium]